MRWLARATQLAGLALAASSCKGQPDITPWCSAAPPPPAPDVPATPTYYEHTRAVIDAKCAFCHVSDGIGPFPLTTYGRMHAGSQRGPCWARNARPLRVALTTMEQHQQYA